MLGANRIYNIHAKDSDGLTLGYLPCGTGYVDYTAVLNALHNVGYKQNVSIEVKFTDNPKQYMKQDLITQTLYRRELLIKKSLLHRMIQDLLVTMSIIDLVYHLYTLYFSRATHIASIFSRGISAAHSAVSINPPSGR